MKLWIIALAISAAGGCGHEGKDDDSSTSTRTSQQVSPPATPQRMDSVTGAAPVVENRAQNPGERPPPPNDPNAIDPKHPPKEKPLPRPNPEVIDFRK